MAARPKASRKHHFVPQAQLRHFSLNDAGRSIWVYDKGGDRAWISSIRDAGSENGFNTVDLGAGAEWNFEHLFEEVDARSASLVADIVRRRSIGWLKSEDRRALVDLFAAQTMRTRFARTEPQALAAEIREFARGLGFDPDAGADLRMPSDASLRLGAARSFLGRDRIHGLIARLVPALFHAGGAGRFVLSDDPVVLTNAFPYGAAAFGAHGVVALLPLAPDLAVALVCPTIVARYAMVEAVMADPCRLACMRRWRDGFRSGEPIEVDAADVVDWNRLQVSRSARYLYAADDDFDFARRLLADYPGLREVVTRLASGTPARHGMPCGLQLVVESVADHCMLPIAEVDEAGEGLTARTGDVAGLALVAADAGELLVTLYEDGFARRWMSAATVEPIGDRATGWFRVVHRDAALRLLGVHLDGIRRR